VAEGGRALIVRGVYPRFLGRDLFNVSSYRVRQVLEELSSILKESGDIGTVGKQVPCAPDIFIPFGRRLLAERRGSERPAPTETRGRHHGIVPNSGGLEVTLGN
jgi:hypothetical protein